MTNYAKLTKKRRLIVDLIIKEYPHVLQTGQIKLKEIQNLHVKLYNERDTGGVKIGYPLWLTIEQQYRTGVRGVYHVPLPGNETQEISKEVLTTKRIESIINSSEQAVYEEKDFLAELADAGIEV